MAFGLSTGTMFSPMFRNPLQSNAESGLFTADYEAKTQVGPTKENLAKQQHAADIAQLSDEIAAKETPQAKKDREESGFFSKSAQEKELEAQKAALQKKVEDNALEEAVKRDKYFLIKSEWDRKVIMAANGETVTVELEDTKAKKNADGTYPKKVITIEKSAKLKKISNERPKPKGKTAAMVKEEFQQQWTALREKYEPGFFSDFDTDMVIDFDKFGRPTRSNPLALKQYKLELKQLEEKRDKELVSVANKAAAEPSPQGVNVEPHTIAIHAPGFCLNEGCCLETAFYTLRAAAKTIEDDAEANVDKDIKDQIEENKQKHEELEEAYKTLEEMHKEALKEAKERAAAEYGEAYERYMTIIRDENGKPVNAGPKPDPANYTAEIYLERDSVELLAAYYDYEMEIELLKTEVELSDNELQSVREAAMAKLTTEASNYRLLLDHCTFQPTCPEWLEDVGTGIANAAKKTGEAISDAAEWCWDGVSSAANWVAEGGITRTIDTVGGYINDGLAYMSELQTSLNEYLGFEGLCSLNPFGGTLGCSNCPMGSQCTNTKNSLLDKLKIATNVNDFLKNLKGALGLGNNQLLGNLLKCAAALTGEVGGAISAVENFAIGTGAANILGDTASILNTSALPNWNTKVADCIKCGDTLDQAQDALNLIEKVGGSPASVMSSSVPGLGSSVLDISKLDDISTGSTHFATKALGADKFSAVKQASQLLPAESPKGSTKFFDGKNVDLDTPTKQMKQMAAAGLAFA